MSFSTFQNMPVAVGSAVQERRSSAPPNQTPKMRSNWRPLQVAFHWRMILEKFWEAQLVGGL